MPMLHTNQIRIWTDVRDGSEISSSVFCAFPGRSFRASTGVFSQSVVRLSIEEVISRVRHLGHLANERAVFKGRLAACGVHALDEGRIGEDSGTLRPVRDRAEQQPRDGVSIHYNKIHKGSHDYAAAGALPRRACEMVYQGGVANEQRRVRHSSAPISAIPCVDLKPHAEAVELNFVARVHCDLKWNFRSAIIGARQRSETAAQQQSQRADDDSFLVSFFIHHETFLLCLFYA